MKIYLLFLIILFTIFSANAQNVCRKQTVEQLAESFAKAYKAKNLGQLDKERPLLGKVKFRIENSLAENEKDQTEIKSFTNFKAAEKWLRTRETGGLPARNIIPLTECKKGVCTYNLQGLLHNNLFLTEFTFGYKKDKCPFIKTVFLIDGN